MTPHDLKNSVWQLAVQGKLVEQCPDEGTGEELFQQIQSEKNSLIKAGKIKQIVVTNIARLFRNPVKITSLFENNYMKNVDIVTLDGECINRKYYAETLKKLGFEKLARDIKRKQIKNRHDKSR